MDSVKDLWPTEQAFIYRFLQLHLATLFVLFIKQDYIRQIYAHMKLVSSVAAFQALLVVIFKQWNHYKMERVAFKGPEDPDFLKWQKDMHKDERDIYLATACLLAQGLVFSICYHRDRYERYVDYRLSQDREIELQQRKQKESQAAKGKATAVESKDSGKKNE